MVEAVDLAVEGSAQICGYIALQTRWGLAWWFWDTNDYLKVDYVRVDHVAVCGC